MYHPQRGRSGVEIRKGREPAQSARDQPSRRLGMSPVPSPAEFRQDVDIPTSIEKMVNVITSLCPPETVPFQRSMLKIRRRRNAANRLGLVELHPPLVHDGASKVLLKPVQRASGKVWTNAAQDVPTKLRFDEDSSLRES